VGTVIYIEGIYRYLEENIIEDLERGNLSYIIVGKFFFIQQFVIWDVVVDHSSYNVTT